MTKGIVYILANDEDVQDLVGTKTTITDEYKVYPLIVPQEEVQPYIVCRMLANPPVPCKGEVSTSFTPIVQAACYHKNYEDVLSIEQAVKTALDNKRGSYNGVNFSYIRYIDSSEDWIHRSLIEYKIRLLCSRNLSAWIGM